MKSIKVDQDACISCGACLDAAGDYFEFNDEGKSHPKKELDENDTDTVQQAIDGCPVDAISIEE